LSIEQLDNNAGDHHDKAYDWAERRKLETHPTTGAAQLVEIRETRFRPTK
jgi:hypothetical protein